MNTESSINNSIFRVIIEYPEYIGYLPKKLIAPQIREAGYSRDIQCIKKISKWINENLFIGLILQPTEKREYVLLKIGFSMIKNSELNDEQKKMFLSSVLSRYQFEKENTKRKRLASLPF